MHSWLLMLILAARIYVADTSENKLSVIDSGRPGATIAVSAFPQAIAFDGRRLYVSSGANVLDVVDANTSRLVRSVPLPPKPGSVAISPDRRSLFVCSGSRPAIDVVDTASLMKVKSIETSGVPGILEVTPDGTRFLAGYNGGIDVINIRTGEKEFVIPVSGEPDSIAIESDRHLAIRQLFIHTAGAAAIEIVDYPSRKVVKKIPLPSLNKLAISPDRQTLWATTSDSVVVFGLPDLKTIATVPTGAGADAIIFEGKQAWVSNKGANSVSEIDIATHKVVTTVPTGKGPGRMIAVE